MNSSTASQARRPSWTFTTSAIERASCRTEATSVDTSWTAPMNTTPRVIHRMAGPQPNA